MRRVDGPQELRRGPDRRDRAAALALREPEFRRFYGSFVAFTLSQSMLRFLLPWLAYEITHSTLVLGLFGLAVGGLQAGLSPIGGVWADRVDVRAVIRITQACAAVLALALAALVLIAQVHAWLLLVIAAGFGCVFAFDQPARQALLPLLVTGRGLSGATSLVGMTWNISGIVGPGLASVALAVLLTAGVGAWPLFVIVAVGYLALTRTIAGIEPRARELQPRRHWVREIQEGLVFMLGERIQRSMIVLTVANSVLGASYVQLMPAFAHDVFHTDVTGLGILVASVGVGGAIGAAVTGLNRGARHYGATALGASLLLGTSLIAFGAASNFPVAVALAALGGAANGAGFVAALSLVQTVVPPHLYGRALGLLAVSSSVAPVGAALLGTLALPIGVQAAVSVGGAGIVVIALVVWRSAPDLVAR